KRPQVSRVRERVMLVSVALALLRDALNDRALVPGNPLVRLGELRLSLSERQTVPFGLPGRLARASLGNGLRAAVSVRYALGGALSGVLGRYGGLVGALRTRLGGYVSHSPLRLISATSAARAPFRSARTVSSSARSRSASAADRRARVRYFAASARSLPMYSRISGGIVLRSVRIVMCLRDWSRWVHEKPPGRAGGYLVAIP